MLHEPVLHRLHMSCTRKLLHCAPSLHIQYIYFEWGKGIQKLNTYLHTWRSSKKQTFIIKTSSSFKYTTFCFVCIANYLSSEENTVHFIQNYQNSFMPYNYTVLQYIYINQPVIMQSTCLTYQQLLSHQPIQQKQHLYLLMSIKYFSKSLLHYSYKQYWLIHNIRTLDFKWSVTDTVQKKTTSSFSGCK
jgi:hypothetical protein